MVQMCCHTEQQQELLAKFVKKKSCLKGLIIIVKRFWLSGITIRAKVASKVARQKKITQTGS